MEKHLFDMLHRINYLTAETDALYHQAALKVGLSDSAMRVLYTIYDNGESCPLSNIYKQSGTSKQTVNSAIRKLEAEGMIRLEQQSGRSKRVFFTETGKQYADETIARIFEAETAAFSSWADTEIAEHLRLTEKYVDTFREQVEKL